MADTMLARGPAAAHGRGSLPGRRPRRYRGAARRRRAAGCCETARRRPALERRRSRRLACDAALVALSRARPAGRRASAARPAAIPPALRRALARARPRLPVPGLLRSRALVDAHHIRHWARGGATRLDNLVTSAATTTGWCTKAARVTGTPAARSASAGPTGAASRRAPSPRPVRSRRCAPARSIRQRACSARPSGSTCDGGWRDALDRPARNGQDHEGRDG